MKKINIFKSLRTLVFALVGLVLAGGVFFACQNHNDDAPEGDALLQEGVEYPIPENAIVLVEPIRFVQQGELGWYDTEGKGDPVWFGGAAFYYLPKDIKNYEGFARLIQGDKEVPYTILKITLGEQKEATTLGTPIVNVELPTSDEIGKNKGDYRNMASDIRIDKLLNVDHELKTKRSALSTTMSMSRAQQFFNQFKNMRCDWILQNPCLPFQYAKDGCYARAHYMKKLMEEAGYSSQKIFAFANTGALQAYTKANCCVAWGWHVAPLVGVATGYSTQLMVIDPSLFDEPVAYSTWINKMKSTCYGYPYPTIQHQITSSQIYLPNGETDDDYSKTYQTLSNYSTLSGCNWWLKRSFDCIA